MDLSSYFKMAVYFCLMMIIFTMCVNFVSALHIFEDAAAGLNTEKAEDGVLTVISGLSGGWEWLWLLLVSGTGIAAIGLAKVMGSTNIIGVYLFSTIFWSSYSRCITVVNIGSLVNPELLAIFTVAIAFVWIAAIISMFTGVS